MSPTSYSIYFGIMDSLVKLTSPLFFKIFPPQFEFGPIRSPNELSQLQILQDGVAPKYLIGSKFKSWREKTKNSESEVEVLKMT